MFIMHFLLSIIFIFTETVIAEVGDLVEPPIEDLDEIDDPVKLPLVKIGDEVDEDINNGREGRVVDVERDEVDENKSDEQNDTMSNGEQHMFKKMTASNLDSGSVESDTVPGTGSDTGTGPRTSPSPDTSRPGTGSDSSPGTSRPGTGSDSSPPSDREGRNFDTDSGSELIQKLELIYTEIKSLLGEESPIAILLQKKILDLKNGVTKSIGKKPESTPAPPGTKVVGNGSEESTTTAQKKAQKKLLDDTKASLTAAQALIEELKKERDNLKEGKAPTGDNLEEKMKNLAGEVQKMIQQRAEEPKPHFAQKVESVNEQHNSSNTMKIVGMLTLFI